MKKTKPRWKKSLAQSFQWAFFLIFTALIFYGLNYFHEAWHP